MAEVIHFTAQFKENTYQFISRLAQRWGEFLYFEDGKMVFGKMKQTDPVELYPDVDILGYYYDLNLESIDTGFSYWDYYTTDGPICEAETIRSLDSKESHKLTETVMAHAYDLYPTCTLEEAQCVPAGTSRIDHATEVAKSQYYYKKARMMMCKAVTNRCDLKLGSVVVIKEYADTDTGVELKSHEPLQIIGIRYQWDINGHFQNEFTAIPSTLEYPPYLNPNLYPKSGVQHAVVTDVDDAEGHMGRVKVTFHMGGLQTSWIRVARPYAGTDQGVIFTPAKNQEVLVGFVNDNVEQPFVIGAVHNAIQKPKVDWDCTGNTIKGIRTANHEILICDSNDGNGYIRISDYDNRHFDIVLDADSKTITVKSAGDIIFEAGNDISFKAKHHINMRAGHRLVEKVGTSLEQHVGRDALIDIGHHYNQHVAGHAEVTIDGKTLLHAQDDFWISGQKLVKVYSQDTVVCHGKEDATFYSEDSLCVLGNNNVCIKSKVTDIDADLINLGE